MDLSTLPEGILLEALKLLPFRDVVRLGRVNKRFQQISEIVISKAKSIDFLRSGEPTKNPTAEAFAQLLDLCKTNLEEVGFPVGTNELVKVFTSYSFPHLKCIVIDDFDIDQLVFWKLFLNNDNLREFHWHSETGTSFIPLDACKYLENLHISCLNVGLKALGSFGRSQIKELALTCSEITLITGHLLDEAFGQSPSIEKLKLWRKEENVKEDEEHGGDSDDGESDGEKEEKGTDEAEGGEQNDDGDGKVQKNSKKEEKEEQDDEDCDGKEEENSKKKEGIEKADDADGKEEKMSKQEEGGDADGEEEEGEEGEELALEEEQDEGPILINFHEMQHFWRLSNLVELGIFVKMPSDTEDDVLIKIAASFPQLESLWLCKLDYASDFGVRALATLKNLKNISLGSFYIDNGVRYLAEQGRLEGANFFNCFLRPATFTAVVQSSPKMRWLSVRGILTNPDWHTADTAEMAATIIESISAPFKINLDVSIGCCCRNKGIWNSEEVKAALEGLKEKEGHVIKFE